MLQQYETTVSKDLPMTPAQANYLRSLAERAGVEYRGDLTKQMASRRIDELRDRLRG